MKYHVVYLSYDGLTDPLGQSQILPYIIGLSEKGFSFTIISAEKASRFKVLEGETRDLLRRVNVKWIPLKYHKWPPILSTCLDLWLIRFKVLKLISNLDINFIHCRSYLTALIALELNKKHGLKYVFDMRGFWADERIEGGIWPQRFPYNTIYWYFKRKERELLSRASHTIVLTHKAKEIITDRFESISKEDVSIIPCAVDSELFHPHNVPPNAVIKIREKLGLSQKASPVLTCIGSLGTWYLIDEVISFFKAFLRRYPLAQLIVVTKDDWSKLSDKVSNDPQIAHQVTFTSGSRNEMPLLIALGDYSIFFIKPSFSKLASSPTRQGEIMCMGVPVITNTGIGDSDEIIGDKGSGVLVRGFDPMDFERAIDEMEGRKFDSSQIRSAGMMHYDLVRSIDTYLNVYRKVLR